MDFVYRIEGSRLNTKLYYHQHDHENLYHKRWARNGKIYFSCSKNYCGATAMCDEHDVGEGHEADENQIGPIIVGINFRLGLKPHNHMGDLSCLPNIALVNTCKRRAITEGNTSLRLIYDEERARQPLNTLSFAALENCMRKARRRTLPAVPATILDLVALVQVDERYNTTSTGERMLLQIQELGIDGTNLLFVSPPLRMAAALATEVHLDGTFKVVPPMFHQLLTVHFVAMNHTFPVVYALMQRKTRTSYIAVLRVCRDLLGMAPASVFCDYELALVQAVQTVFPAARVTGCLFHFAQAIWRKIQRLGLVREMRDDGRLKAALRMAMAIPFLPARDVEAGVLAVEVRAAGSPAAAFPTFMRYLRRFWLTAVGAEVVSVYGQPRRTNNSVESFHRVLSKNIAPHPNPLNFLVALRKVEACQAGDYLLASTGQPIRRRRRPANLANHTRIRDAMREFANEAINVSEYLLICSHAMEGLGVVEVGEEQDFEDDHDEEYPPFVGLLPDVGAGGGGAGGGPEEGGGLEAGGSGAGVGRDPVAEGASSGSTYNPTPPVIVIPLTAAGVAGPSETSRRLDSSSSSHAIQDGSDDSNDSYEDFLTRPPQINFQEQRGDASGNREQQGDASGNRERPGTNCLICLSSPVSCHNQPCGHVVACYNCMVRNQSYRSTCPYCKAEVLTIHQVMVRGAD